MNAEQFQHWSKIQREGIVTATRILENQATERKETSERVKAEAQVKRIAKCDGASTRRLRQWFADVELTQPYTPYSVYVASQSAEGVLRTELERSLNALPDRSQATWPALKKHLSDTFLSKHEADRLRDEVDKLQQGPYEVSGAYGRRFREAANLGYPTAQRNADQQRIMLGHI